MKVRRCLLIYARVRANKYEGSRPECPQSMVAKWSLSYFEKAVVGKYLLLHRAPVGFFFDQREKIILYENCVDFLLKV